MRWPGRFVSKKNPGCNHVIAARIYILLMLKSLFGIGDCHASAAGADNALILLQAGGFVQFVCSVCVFQADGGDGNAVQLGREDQFAFRFRGQDGRRIILQQDILVISAPDDAVAGRINGIPDAVEPAVGKGGGVRGDNACEPGTGAEGAAADVGHGFRDRKGFQCRTEGKRPIADRGQSGGQGDAAELFAVLERVLRQVG